MSLTTLGVDFARTYGHLDKFGKPADFRASAHSGKDGNPNLSRYPYTSVADLSSGTRPIHRASAPVAVSMASSGISESDVNALTSYIPSDILTLYIGALAAIGAAVGGTDRADALFFDRAAFIVCLVLTPVWAFLAVLLASPGFPPFRAWIWPVIAGIIAFVAYAFAIPSDWIVVQTGHGQLFATLAVLLVTPALMMGGKLYVHLVPPMTSMSSLSKGEKNAMKRALLVGINEYPNPQDELKGCINDVDDFHEFLVAKCGFQSSDISVLKDADATRAAITEGLHRLVSSASPGDSLVFVYSGHGCQIPITDGNGVTSGSHDAICPVDFAWVDDQAQNAIRDIEFQALLSGIPNGARLTWIADSCFSGGYAKLFGMYRGPAPVKRIKMIPAPPSVHSRLMNMTAPTVKVTRMKDIVQTIRNLIVAAACGAQFESLDGSFNDRPNGVLTHYLLQELLQGNGMSETALQAIAAVDQEITNGPYSGQMPELHGDQSLFTQPILKG